MNQPPNQRKHDNAESIDQLYPSFIGPNADFYILHWAAMKDRAWSWNWSAFFFGEGWLLYRKMYLYGIAYALLKLLLAPSLNSINIFENIYLNQLVPFLMPYTSLIDFLTGLFGNRLYKTHTDRAIKSAQESSPHLNPDLRLRGLGGVSMTALLLIPVFSSFQGHLMPNQEKNDPSLTQIVQTMNQLISTLNLAPPTSQ